MARARPNRRKKSPSSGERSSLKKNQEAYWKAYQRLETQADRAWRKFQSDVKKNAKSDIILKDQSELRLLLGECNYMARECMRLASQKRIPKR